MTRDIRRTLYDRPVIVHDATDAADLDDRRAAIKAAEDDAMCELARLWGIADQEEDDQ